MTRKLLISLTASAALAAPLAAQAEDATSPLTISGDVEKACVISQPSEVTLQLDSLTDAQGHITSELAGGGASATHTITDAWCNTPSTLSLDADPMALTTTPAYSTPAGFARLITYDATLSGWPTALVDRPILNSPAETATADNAHAADLVLVISSLAAINASGAENPSAVLEAGAYAGSIVVSVAVQ